ncbi:diguanylate cyclase [Oryzibacter oryziterrae]|uniref:diguanylate cyclase n=1 Tax=Oryzibacter oryziterrae TaxID=2766474 RepID=UPI001F02E3C0|nr:diguanylate cyclase [Oryzibacter oryziterrae]
MSLTVLVFVATLFGLFATGARAWRLPHFAGKTDYLLIIASSAWWLVFAAVDAYSTEPADKILASEIAWYGIITTPVFWMTFMATYIRGSEPAAARSHRFATLALGAVTLAIALTNDWHGGIYASVTPDPTPAYPHRLHFSHGFIYNVLAAVVYVAMLATTVQVGLAARRASGLHRRQFLGLLGAALVPWAANAGYNFGNLRILGFDPTPIAFVCIPVVYHVLIARHQLFSLAPVAHHAVFNSHPDSMLVVSASGIVAEANPAAIKLFEASGNPVGQLFAALKANFVPQRTIDASGHAASELCSRDGLTFELRSTTVLAGGKERASIHVFRDVTAIHSANLKLGIAARLMEERLDANVKLHEQLREMALRDSLTGLYNRRSLDEICASMIRRAAEAGQTVSFALIDIDHFKAINDTFGHRAGDDALVRVAAALTAELLPGEMAVRMGGEEFLLAMPDVDEVSAFRRVESCRKALSQDGAGDGAASAVRFSAGLITCEAATCNIETMLTVVDRALYQAKRTGRNRTVVAAGDARSIQDRLARVSLG